MYTKRRPKSWCIAIAFINLPLSIDTFLYRLSLSLYKFQEATMVNNKYINVFATLIEESDGSKEKDENTL